MPSALAEKASLDVLAKAVGATYGVATAAGLAALSPAVGETASGRLGRARKALVRISRAIRRSPHGQSFRQDIAPDAAGATGAVADPEARPDRCDALRIMDLAGAGWAAEPGMKAGPRSLRNLAEPADRPDVAVFGDEGEPHILSADRSNQWRNQPQTRAKKAAAFFEACHAPRAAGRPLSSEPKSRPDRPASARSRGKLWPGLWSVPASTDPTRSPQRQGHGPPALPLRPHSSGN
ncbi:hypothetical protein XINFAN_03733 [Pseudogemmobacter humi]|uniref:Uncharacterized protein n=1 Tax=Pseudogemmobacter humi TaxID=2483812 RepID=A0A3P5XEU9_9RHOB|nr:hypothetical protein XINFAN_03733 [Pseudogemmobacter humi]